MGKKYIEVRKIVETETLAANEKRVIEISVRYNIGGINYSNYKQEPRGYYVHVQPIKIKDEASFTVISFRAFTGYKQFLFGVTRQSKKQAERAEILAREVLKEMVQQVMEEQGLEYVDEVETSKFFTSKVSQGTFALVSLAF